MEWGFLQCTSKQNTVRLPITHIPKHVVVFVSGIENVEEHSLNFMEVPLTFDENNELHIARMAGPFYWVVLNKEEEALEVAMTKIKKPEQFFYTYDARTGLIHLICDKKTAPPYWGYKAGFDVLEADKYHNPVVEGILENDFVSVGTAFAKTWYNTNDFKTTLGVISSWNVPCGIAEYTRQILEKCDFGYFILSPYANDALGEDEKNVYRCFDRENINNLKETIERLKIDNLWIHYSYTWFRDDLWENFLHWCKDKNIRYHIYAHSAIKSHHEELCSGFSSGSSDNENRIPIAPPDFYLKKPKHNKYWIGSFGFAHPHKRFEEVFAFIKQNPKFHYHIWTSIGQGIRVNEIGVDYLEYLDRVVHNQGIQDRVHFHVGFLREEELLKKLSECSVLVLPYKDIPGENQSAAVALMRASGRPIITTTSYKVREFGDLATEDITQGIHTVLGNLSAFEKQAQAKKIIYTKTDEMCLHLDNIKPYGGTKIKWRGDLVGVKSFSIVNKKYIEILQNWGAEIALLPDNNDFVMSEEPDFIQKVCRNAPKDDMISTGIHFPPLVSYCDYPIGAWETSICPNSWSDAIGPKFRKLISISEFCTQAFIKGGFREKDVVTVPLGTDIFNINYEKRNIYKVSNIKTRNLKDRPFTFLNLCWPEPRKGTDILIDAYTRSFTKQDNVVLAIKTTSTNDWINRLIPFYKNKRPNSAHIVLLEGLNCNMEDIYQAADVVVHPHRGEGFGLPLLEAAGYGIPSITTGWAGPLDFTTKNTGWYIDYRLLKSEYHHHVEGAKWAQPNTYHLSKIMKYAYSHPQEVEKRGYSAFLNAHKFSWDLSALKLLEVFNG